jgi:glycosyltransferase involved in cell wall biosynthesis
VRSLSICVPVYKGSGTLKRALESIFRQNYDRDFEVVILDDNKSSDIKEINSTKKIIDTFKTDKIRYFRNVKNFGSALTIQRLAHLAKKDILTFLCQDDIFAHDAIVKIVNGFKEEDVGVLTRPFFWFEEDIACPIRAVYPYDKNKNSNIGLFNCSERAIKFIFGSVGQISGLAYRTKYLTCDFTDDVFPGHIYPFAEILKKHKCMFLKDYIVAVSLKTSQTRYNSKIYENSPLEAWVKMFKTVYPYNVGNGQDCSQQQKYRVVREIGIQNIATHYEGLVQIKNYGTFKSLIREIFLHVKFCPSSLIYPKFWFYVLLTFFIPRKILVFLSDFYKRHILAKKIGKICFNF